MAESGDRLLITLENGVKRITFNNPGRRNSVSVETIERMRDAVQESAEDGTRVVILTGAGDSFCAGADLAATSERDIANYDVTRAIREHVNPTIMAMRALPVPVIARVHGHAVGVGHNYALACDMIVASEEALFGQVFIKIGLMPDGGSTFVLPRLVGYQKAFEMMTLGEIINAQDALRLGIVNAVVPFAELDATVDSIAARLVAAPQVALARIKAALNNSFDATFAEQLDYEAVGQDACFHSDDFLEGVTAFVEKRKPVFNKAAGSANQD